VVGTVREIGGLMSIRDASRLIEKKVEELAERQTNLLCKIADDECEEGYIELLKMDLRRTAKELAFCFKVESVL